MYVRANRIYYLTEILQNSFENFINAIIRMNILPVDHNSRFLLVKNG